MNKDPIVKFLLSTKKILWVGKVKNTEDEKAMWESVCVSLSSCSSSYLPLVRNVDDVTTSGLMWICTAEERRDMSSRRRRRHHEDHHHHHHFPPPPPSSSSGPWSGTTQTSLPRDPVGFSPPPPSCFSGSWSCTTGSPPDPGASSKFLIPLLFSYTNMSCIVMFHSLLSKLLCVKNKY